MVFLKLGYFLTESIYRNKVISYFTIHVIKTSQMLHYLKCKKNRNRKLRSTTDLLSNNTHFHCAYHRHRIAEMKLSPMKQQNLKYEF